MAGDMEVAVSYCIVNTEQRALLLRCLDAVARERAALPFATEVLVLDNASRDGSAGAARAHPAVDELVRLGQRRGKGANDSALLAACARPLLPAAQRGRRAAARRDRRARGGARGARRRAAAGAELVGEGGSRPGRRRGASRRRRPRC